MLSTQAPNESPMQVPFSAKGTPPATTQPPPVPGNIATSTPSRSALCVVRTVMSVVPLCVCVQICGSLSLQTLVQNVPRCDVMCCDVQCCAVLCCVVFRRAVYPQVRKDPPQAPRGCSNATRQASQSELGPALQSLFSRGQGTEAQWHKGITALSLQLKQPRNLNATKQHRQQTFGNSTALALAPKGLWRWHIYTTCVCKDPYSDLNLCVPSTLGDRYDAHVFACYRRWYRPV